MFFFKKKKKRLRDVSLKCYLSVEEVREKYEDDRDFFVLGYHINCEEKEMLYIK